MESKKKSPWKKRILVILFVLLNVAVIVWTARNEYVSANDSNNKAVNIADIKLKWPFLLFTAICFIIAIGAEMIKYNVLIKRTTGKSRFPYAMKTFLYGRYYDNITPSAIGGQPYQLYYLNKKGLSAAQSATVVIISFFSMQVAFIIIALYIVLFGGSLVKVDAIRIISYFGLVIYAFSPCLIIFFTFFNNIATKILTAIVNFLHKIKIIKNEEKINSKIEHSVKDYAAIIRANIKDWKLWIKVMGLSFIYQIAYSSLPFFVLYTFGGSINYFECLFTTFSIYMAITFIPTPGNAGAAEISFALVFSSLTVGYIFWATLTWRFFCYYIFLLIGVIMYISRFFHNRKLEKENRLPNPQN